MFGSFCLIQMVEVTFICWSIEKIWFKEVIFFLFYLEFRFVLYLKYKIKINKPGFVQQMTQFNTKILD
jgi:hypothetical protein